MYWLILCAGADVNIVGNVQDVIDKNDGDGDSAFNDDIKDIVHIHHIENVDHLAAAGEILAQGFKLNYFLLMETLWWKLFH